MERSLALAWATSLVIAGTGAGAQAPAEPPADPLRGPRVQPADAGPPTLVERGFDGSMSLLEERPETAALKRLTLSDAERKAVDEILAQRGANVQSVLSEHTALFLELQGARQGNDREAIRRLMPQFREAAAELLTPPLRERLATALTPQNAEELNRLVDDYLRQMPVQGARQPGQPVPEAGEAGRAPLARARPDRSGQRMEINLTIREMARAVSGIVSDRCERTDAMLKAIGATPEQESKIHAILRDGSGVGQPTEEQRAQRMRRIMNELTPEQRAAWLKAARAL